MTTLYKLKEYKADSTPLISIGKKIFEQTSSLKGNDFLKEIVQQYVTSLQAQTVFIARLNTKDKSSLQTIIHYTNNNITDNIEIGIENSIWKTSISLKESICINHITESYPNDLFFTQNGYNSAICIPLINSNQDILGIIGCLFQKPLENMQLLKDIVQLFAPRIAVEIEKLEILRKLKQTENHFSQITENTSSWLWEVDSRGKYTYTSNRIQSILGYEPKDIVDKRYFYDLYPEEVAKKNKDKILKDFKLKKVIKNFEHCKQHKDGHSIFLTSFGVPILNSNGDLVAYRGTSIDISKQKENELRIKEQHQFLITVLNSLNHPFRVINVHDNSITWYNHASLELNSNHYVYDQKEYPYLSIEESSPFHSVLQTGESIKSELIVRNEKGKEYPSEIHCHPIFDEKGKMIQIIEYSIDISERKKTEWTLQQRVRELECMHRIAEVLEKDKDEYKHTFQKIAQIIPSGFHLESHTGCRIQIGNEIVRTKTFSFNNNLLTSIIARDGKQIGSIEVSCNTQSKHNPFLKEEKKMLETITQQLGHYYTKKQEEKVREIIYTVSEAVNSTESIEELIALIHQQIALLVDARNFFIGFYNTDKDHFTIPYVADERINIKEFPGGKSLSKYLIKQKKPMIITEQKLHELETSGEVVSVGERAKCWLGVPFIEKNEAFGILGLQSYESENAYDQKDLEVLEFLSNQIGVSVYRKKAESNLKSALEKSQESDKLKSAFLSSISHELRTPLNAIIGFSELIDNNLSHQETVEFASLINKSGKNLLLIIDNILNMTQLASDKNVVQNQKFNVLHLCEKVISHSTAKCQQKKLKVRFKPCEKVSKHLITSDQTKLFHILTNLLDNAIKFTPKGDIELGYSCFVKRNERYIRFYVRDRGIGISEDKLHVIFDLFRQVEDSHARRFSGVGLGLAIVYNYTKLLNGVVKVYSEKEKGSVFSVILPINDNQ
eukprot:TRINITY_DN1801_c0_g3_i1.p1 TRINITY_DN1801_c0_g3~~TRINITY_DN1801_c0_g3_i1.p1  ORF type:complete len:953 (-),score=59.04 TRINITY_DN1801_c0_g3_i1:1448-4306(-)